MNKYGLVGKSLSYSFSKIIHEYLIEEFKLDASYDLIETDKLTEELISSYDGLNITIPYKQDVVNYVSDNSKIGVCNVVYNNNGYNVDIDGFMYLYNQLSNITNTVVLGNGACAKLIKNSISNVTTVETLNKNITNISGDLLVNATPVGMNSYEAIVSEDIVKNFKAVIDLNYNPLNSRLKYLCYKNQVKYIGGLEMLVVQAIKSFEIFNNIKVEAHYINKVVLKVLGELNLNIAIVGMPLAGKSTITSKYNGTDIDKEIEKRYDINSTIEIESEFRKIETATIKNNLEHKLICLGGGAVKTSENLKLLKDHLIIFLNEDLEVLKSRYKPGTRPLLKELSDVEKTYEARIELYKNFSNIEMSYNELEVFLDEYFNN